MMTHRAMMFMALISCFGVIAQSLSVFISSRGALNFNAADRMYRSFLPKLFRNSSVAFDDGSPHQVDLRTKRTPFEWFLCDHERKIEHWQAPESNHYKVLAGFLIIVLICWLVPTCGVPVIKPSQFRWRPHFFVSSSYSSVGPIALGCFRLFAGVEFGAVFLYDFLGQSGDDILDYALYYSMWTAAVTALYLLIGAYVSFRYGRGKMPDAPERLPASVQWMWALGTSLFSTQVFLTTLGYWIGVLTSSTIRENWTNKSKMGKIVGLHVHGLGAVYMIIEFLIARLPLLLEHVFYPIVFTGLWIASAAYYQYKESAREEVHGPLDFVDEPEQTAVIIVWCFNVGIIIHVGLTLIKRKWERQPLFMSNAEFLGEYCEPLLAAQTGDASGRNRYRRNRDARAIGGKVRAHVGPLQLSANGIVMKPKLNLGIQGDSVYAMAGVRDVRDGLAAEAFAMAMKSYSASGSSLADVLTSIKAEDPVPVLDDLVEAIPDIAAAILQEVGVGVMSKSAYVEGVVYVYVGVGVSAGLFLGWLDTGGYRMVGLEGTFATGVAKGITLKAGLNESRTKVRVTVYLANVGFDAVVTLKQQVR